MTVSRIHAAARALVALPDGRTGRVIFVRGDWARVHVSGRRERFPLDQLTVIAPDRASLIADLRRIAAAPAGLTPHDVIRRTAIAAIEALTKENP